MDTRGVLRHTDREYRKNAVVDTSRMTSSQRAAIESKIPELIDYLLDFRKALDAVQTAKDYPVGYCREITDSAFINLRREDLIKRFQSEGIVFKKIWGVFDETFQNAMQLGHLYIDTAGDTVDPALNATRIKPLAESRFREIRDYEDYLNITQNYWGLNAVPNYVFPFLSGILPYIFTFDDKACFSMYHSAPLLSRDIRGGFPGAEEVMLKKLRGKQLTPKQLEFLVRSLEPEYRKWVTEYPKLQKYLTPQTTEKTEEHFRAMKEMWTNDNTFPGVAYCLVTHVFHPKLL